MTVDHLHQLCSVHETLNVSHSLFKRKNYSLGRAGSGLTVDGADLQQTSVLQLVSRFSTHPRQVPGFTHVPPSALHSAPTGSEGAVDTDKYVCLTIQLFNENLL
ncbi:hypothetical protein DPMN_110021 [Dreissena polymorpha]|uniref:Uncharacterized protein n=1 Tax=Dreissena polymorpha TaxID=45954 RepID=A0A9D4KBT7_DREPO|nr:hypothetical protein DPMN_110021 [Dreissena polymorpha]